MTFLRGVPGTESRVPHISLVFREMWDTANFYPLTRSAHESALAARPVGTRESSELFECSKK
jgi:hypothetical protein